MKLKNLLTDDDAVSPVIGVILMVAITVILSAVIAGVVMGLGQDKTSTAPQASFAFETVDANDDGTADEVKVIHDGGDNLDASNIEVKESGGSDYNSPPSTISAGDSWVASDGITDGDTVRVVWNDPDTDESSTLGEFEA